MNARLGSHVCSYVVEAAYEGKRPFLIGTFTVPREETFHATEQKATDLMAEQLARFFGDHFPDGTPLPIQTTARLGSVTFVPDDYEWRRTK